MRTIRYQQIADELRSWLADGAYGPGRLLPSEAELGAEFDASRVTVRRALEVLRDEGLVAARQGFGWFVAAAPLRQDLGRLATIEGQLLDSGIHPERRILAYEFAAASPHAAEVLGTKQVLVVRRLNLADGEPFAVVTVWCPAELGQHLSRAEVERSPFYELLDIPLHGATQTIGADAASLEVAELLHVPPGSPVLRCERVTTDTTGRKVLLSEHIFPAYRTEFVVDLPHAEPSLAPSGLRLVD